MESARSERDIDPFSSSASMIAVRDGLTPGAAGRRPFSSIVCWGERSLRLRGETGLDLCMLETL